MNKIAVIMSVYKNDTFDLFESALNSILNQTYNNLHIFICADGPISPKIKQLIKGLDHNIVTFISNEQNKGLSVSLNRLIDIVLREKKYEFIARMDADDISVDTRFEKQVDYLIKNPITDVIGTKCQEFGSNNARKTCSIYENNDEIYHNIFKRCPFIHPSVMFRCHVFCDGTRYPVDTPYTEDLHLWFILASKNKVFHNLNDILLNYRIDDKTLERRRGFRKAITEFSIRIKYIFILKRYSIQPIFYTFAHFFVRILPVCFFKKIYLKRG